MEYRSGVWKIIIPNLGLLILTVFVCGWLWRWSIDPQNLPITNVKIANSFEKVTQQQIQHEVDPFLKYGFMTIPIAKLREALLQLTWVDKVTVRRVWPASLEIKITEQQAVARLGSGGVLNSDGLLFHPDEQSVPANLPLIQGPSEHSQAIFQHYQVLQSMLITTNLKIVSVQVSPRRSWQIQLDNQMIVVLGVRDHRARLHRFIKALPQLQEKTKESIRQVDLRYPNGLAVS